MISKSKNSSSVKSPKVPNHVNSEKPLKILFATDSFHPRLNGVTIAIDRYKQGLELLGHEVHVFASDYPGAYESDMNVGRIDVHRFKSYPLFFSPEDRLVYPFEKKFVNRMIKDIRPDIIHVQTEFTMGRYAWEYAGKNKIPLVMSAHTTWEDMMSLYFPFVPEKIGRLYVKRRLRKVFGNADSIIAPSDIIVEMLKNYGVTRDITIIPTGLNLKKFSGVSKEAEKRSSELFRKFPQMRKRPVLLYTGRLSREKNIPFLFDVMRKVIHRCSDALLVIAGHGPIHDELVTQVSHMGLTGNVLFAGFIEHDLIKHLYALADVFVFPGKSESQGLVVIESMACSTPVVAIGEKGTRYVMNGNNGGFMVGDNAGEFASRVMDLLTDKKLYREKSKEALQYSKKWDISKTVEDMVELYRNVIRDQSQR